MRLFPALLVLLAASAAVRAVEVKDCADNEYYDTSALICRACGENQEPDRSVLTATGEPAACKCVAGFSSQLPECPINQPSVCDPAQCVSCLDDGLAAASDGSACMSCDAATGATLSTEVGDCVCPEGLVLVERNAEGALLPGGKACQRCPNGTRVMTTATGSFPADPYTCARCPDEQMTLGEDGSCNCGEGFTKTGVEQLGPQQCLPSAQVNAITPQFPSTTASIVVFSDVQSTVGGELAAVDNKNSLYIRHYYLSSAVHCFNFRGPQDLAACQTLGNLCVLQMYSRAAVACQLFEQMRTARGTATNNILGWADSLPWLYYEEEPQGVLTASLVSMSVSFDAIRQPSTFEFLRFKLARYTLDGRYLGMQDLVSQFQYCTPGLGVLGAPSYDTRWQKFGVSIDESYNCNLTTLIQQAAGDSSGFTTAVDSDAGLDVGPISLFDLFIVDEATGKLVAVPVSILNYRAGSDTPNVNALPSDTRDDVLTRRFFLYDAITGITQANEGPEVIRYADSIHLRITTQANSANNINPPVLYIHYTEREPADFNAESGLGVAELSFKVEYTQAVATNWSQGLAAASAVVVLIAWGLSMLSYQRRNTRRSEETACTPATLLRSLLQAVGIFSNVFFWYLFTYSCYWLLFFKMQSKVFTLLPSEDFAFQGSDEYASFRALLIAVFIMKILHMITIVVMQTSVDIFFIDWEKPRGSVWDMETREESPTPVSIWRTLFVANEWGELQSERSTSLELTLILVAFLLSGLGWENWATAQPTLGDLTPRSRNIILRFSTTALWWVAINWSQRLWNFAIGHRFITEPLHSRFVDLCTMAKISVLILDEKYHGYYLHCRSPYQYADGNMVELQEQLRKETEGKTTGRGLPGAPEKDMQTFEVFVTAKWREAYDIFRSPLEEDIDRLRRDGRMAPVRGGLKNKRAAGPRADRLVRAAARLNDFLQGFVEQTDEEHQRMFGVTSFWSRLFSLPPDMQQNRMNVFIPDVDMDFSKVLFLGREMDLMVFNIYTFAISDLLFNNTVVSLLVAYLAERTLLFARHQLGERNIVAKTLIDERFLL